MGKTKAVSHNEMPENNSDGTISELPGDMLGLELGELLVLTDDNVDRQVEEVTVGELLGDILGLEEDNL